MVALAGLLCGSHIDVLGFRLLGGWGDIEFRTVCFLVVCWWVPASLDLV